MLDELDLAAEVDSLVRRAAETNHAFMNGDMTRWLDLTPHGADYSLMSPFGGWTASGLDASPENLAAMAAYFTEAKTELEVISSHATQEMIVLAVVERQHGVVGGLPAQDWTLRVTLVFRRDGATWQLVHRHADPLVNRIVLDQLAVIARGNVPGGDTVAQVL